MSVAFDLWHFMDAAKLVWQALCWRPFEWRGRFWRKLGFIFSCSEFAEGEVAGARSPQLEIPAEGAAARSAIWVRADLWINERNTLELQLCYFNSRGNICPLDGAVHLCYTGVGYKWRWTPSPGGALQPAAPTQAWQRGTIANSPLPVWQIWVW